MTDPDFSSSSGSIKFWGSGHKGVESFRGRQHIELNDGGPTTISQTVAVTPAVTYRWTLAHRGRYDVDRMRVLIDGRVVATISSTSGAWSEHRGLIEVPPGKDRVLFELQSVDVGDGGNLVDNVRLVAVRHRP